jgi:hypothetical protein
MNGMIKTGVKVTANYLSEKKVPMINEYPEDAPYIRNKMPSIKI